MFHPSFVDTHVLLVDDRPSELRSLIETLQSVGMRVSLALDGLQGYHRAVALAPDAVLMDVRMQGMDGFAACRLIKTDPATMKTPVLFLSAAGSEEMRLRGLREGGVDYIVKPCGPLEVAARVGIHVTLARAANHADMEGRIERRRRPRLPLVRNSADGVAYVHAALRYMTQNLAAVHTLQSIAQAVGVSEKRLARVFQASLGMTVFEALRAERMEVAKRLLRDSVLDIGHVAAEVGYPNAANFATAFREHVGTAPSSYRRRNRWPGSRPGELL